MFLSIGSKEAIFRLQGQRLGLKLPFTLFYFSKIFTVNLRDKNIPLVLPSLMALKQMAPNILNGEHIKVPVSIVAWT